MKTEIEMAQEAGLLDADGFPDLAWKLARGRFAALVREDEREACAKVCEIIENDHWDMYKGRGIYKGVITGNVADPHIEGISDGAEMCAAAIRARNTK